MSGLIFVVSLFVASPNKFVATAVITLVINGQIATGDSLNRCKACYDKFHLSTATLSTVADPLSVLANATNTASDRKRRNSTSTETRSIRRRHSIQAELPRRSAYAVSTS